MLKRLGALLAAATLVGTLAVTEAGAAQPALDPGSCGVRASGPIWAPSGNPTGPNGLWAYVVRNRCGVSWTLTAIVAGRSTFCLSVAPGGSATYTSLMQDTNWRVAVC